MSHRETLTAARETRDESGEQSIELRRQLDALRRSRTLIAALVVIATAATLGLSLSLTKTYSASAKVLYDPTADPLSQPSADTLARDLATVSQLATTPGVLDGAAKELGTTRDDLAMRVGAKVDATANIVAISATSHRAADAARTANVVTQQFLAQQRNAELAALRAAAAKVRDEIARLSGRPGSALEVAALRTRLSELSVGEAMTGSSLRVAAAAETPSSPSAPKPIRNALLAFFGALFVGTLVALGRDQLVPRIASARELARISERPVLVSVPFVRRRFGRAPRVLSALENEAYGTLQATIRFQLPPDEPHVVLITSAVEGEGKTTVSVNLGRALARAGRRTLLVSADLRRPKLHERTGVPLSPGLSEALLALEQDDETSRPRTVQALRSLLGARTEHRGNLHVVASGKRPQDPGRLLFSPALQAFFEIARAEGFEYVIVDGPPLLGLADSQALVQRADEVLVVTRLDRSTADDAVEVRDLLERLEVVPVGNVVIGGRRTVPSYYAGDVSALD